MFVKNGPSKTVMVFTVVNVYRSAGTTVSLPFIVKRSRFTIIIYTDAEVMHRAFRSLLTFLHDQVVHASHR